jgi:hypothetical protein
MKEAEKTKPGSGSDTLDLSAWMIDVLLSDGEIELHQRKLLYEFCRKRGVSKRQVEDMIAHSQEVGASVNMKPSSAEEALAWLKSMVIAGLADGSVNQDELLLIRIAGQKLGFSDFTINKLIFEIRKGLDHDEEDGLKSAFFG